MRVIPIAQVVTGVHALLVDQWGPGGDGEPPPPGVSPWWMVEPVSMPEIPPPLAGGEAHRVVGVRLTTVAESTGPVRSGALLRTEATDLADALRGIVLDGTHRIEGPGWRVTGRAVAGWAPQPDKTSWAVRTDFGLYTSLTRPPSP